VRKMMAQRAQTVAAVCRLHEWPTNMPTLQPLPLRHCSRNHRRRAPFPSLPAAHPTPVQPPTKQTGKVAAERRSQPQGSPSNRATAARIPLRAPIVKRFTPPLPESPKPDAGATAPVLSPLRPATIPGSCDACRPLHAACVALDARCGALEAQMAEMRAILAEMQKQQPATGIVAQSPSSAIPSKPPESAPVAATASPPPASSLVLAPLPPPSHVPSEEEKQKREIRYDVFLSHMRVDTADFARVLKTELTDNHGMKCFLDQDANFALTDLMGHVRASSTLVFILSPGILDSQWCKLELREALLWCVQVVLLTMQGSVWMVDGRPCAFPPTRIIEQELRPAFAVKAVEYHRSFHKSSMSQLLHRLGGLPCQSAVGRVACFACANRRHLRRGAGDARMYGYMERKSYPQHFYYKHHEGEKARRAATARATVSMYAHALQLPVSSERHLKLLFGLNEFACSWPKRIDQPLRVVVSALCEDPRRGPLILETAAKDLDDVDLFGVEYLAIDADVQLGRWQ